MQRGIRIPVSSPSIGETEITEVQKALESSWISSLSPHVKSFEQSFSNYVEAKFGVSTNSGTTALHLALAAINLRQGDEIIIPSFTMIASANSAEYQGATIKLVDSDPTTWNMDTNKIEEKITKKTKAIMPVDIYGYPVDGDEIAKIAAENDLYVVEDAAEAHGATYKGRKTGTLGDVGCFSFYANKIITTGEGGMCVTSDEDLAERMAWLRAHAFGRRGKHFWHEELGFGYRMSGLQASLGLGQMKRIDELVKKRIQNAGLYNDLLSKMDKDITLPPDSDDRQNVYWMYSILLKNRKERDGLMKWLESKGIETRTFFYPTHKQPYYSSRFRKESFPVADMLSERGINLPSGNQLTDEQIREVCEEITNYMKGR